MIRFLCIALLASISATCCHAQTAVVTFYSPAISLKSEAAVFLPKSQQPFGGWLSDGPQKLVHFRYGRFATFHLSPGTHSFTIKGPTGSGKQPLVLDVKDGGQYCVRLYAKMINVVVYGQWENQIEEVPCQQLQREVKHLKSIEVKRVDPAVRAEFDPVAVFKGDHQAQH